MTTEIDTVAVATIVRKQLMLALAELRLHTLPIRRRRMVRYVYGTSDLWPTSIEFDEPGGTHGVLASVSYDSALPLGGDYSHGTVLGDSPTDAGSRRREQSRPSTQKRGCGTTTNRVPRS